MRWLHSVAALPPLQCQRTVKPGQSSAPSHHHHHHPAAPGGGQSWLGQHQPRTHNAWMQPNRAFGTVAQMRRAADGVCAHFGAGWG